MNTDPANFAKATDFYGFRFVKPEVLEQAVQTLDALSSPSSTQDNLTIPESGKASNYIELSDWQQWGTGRCSW